MVARYAQVLKIRMDGNRAVYTNSRMYVQLWWQVKIEDRAIYMRRF